MPIEFPWLMTQDINGFNPHVHYFLSAEIPLAVFFYLQSLRNITEKSLRVFLLHGANSIQASIVLLKFDMFNGHYLKIAVTGLKRLFFLWQVVI